VKIVSTKLTFKENAESRIGSLDNAKHKAGGGNVKVNIYVCLSVCLSVCLPVCLSEQNGMYLESAM
jgi:hypothetical protein